MFINYYITSYFILLSYKFTSVKDSHHSKGFKKSIFILAFFESICIQKYCGEGILYDAGIAD